MEPPLHLLQDRCFASCSWLSTFIGKPLSDSQVLFVFYWGTSLASSLSHQNFELCLMVWWALLGWDAGVRNDMLWKGTVEKPDAFMARATSWWLDFQKALKVDRPCQAQPLASDWTKPPPGFLKVNVDDAWRELLKSGGVGAVVRDEHDNFVDASTKTFEHVSSPLLIEAFAVREGLFLAVQKGLHNIIIESDSLQIVPAL